MKKIVAISLLVLSAATFVKRNKGAKASQK